jgi:hypothetical protein
MNGFKLYDLLHNIEFSEDENVRAESRKEFEKLKLDSWNEFAGLRDVLIAELEQVSLPVHQFTDKRE